MATETIRVLLVDDNADDRFAYRRMLGKSAAYRFEISEADSGESALAQLDGAQLVLLDFQLPDASGLDVLEQLRRRHPHLPVIMLTGLEDVTTSVAALKAGADDYQVKGKLGTDSLLRAIRNALETRGLQATLAHERERLELFYRLVEQSADMLFVIAMPERRLLEINPAAAEQLGYSRETLLSADFSLDALFPLFSDSWAALSEANPQRRYECYGVHANGMQVPIEVSSSWARIGGREFYIGVARDITDRKQRDAELQRLVLLDALTGIYNRRAFDERVQQEFLRAARGHGSMGLLMIDIDHFKAYNDHYGHLAGDTCLRQVSQALTATLKRPSDFVARYGGEEFAVLLPDTLLDGSLTAAQHMVARVNELELPHAGSPLGRVTISVGVAAATPPVRGQMDEFITTADACLYVAKSAGRNRAVATAPLEE